MSCETSLLEVTSFLFFLSFFFQLRKKDPGLLVCVTATFKYSRQLKGTYPEAPGPGPSSTWERLQRQ